MERFLAGEAAEQLARIADASREACRQLGADGVEVRYLGSTLVPKDESCFCLFEAASRADVERANRSGGLGYLRISEAVASGEWVGTAT